MDPLILVLKNQKRGNNLTLTPLTEKSKIVILSLYRCSFIRGFSRVEIIREIILYKEDFGDFYESLADKV